MTNFTVYTLEQEFQKLIDSLYSQIQDKQNSGEYSALDAEDLRQMISERMPQGWDSSQSCYTDYDEYDQPQDSLDDSVKPDGWQVSGLC